MSAVKKRGLSPFSEFPPKIRGLFVELAREAEKSRWPLYLVGGAVRDLALGLGVDDFDFAVEGDPKPLAEFCSRRLKAQLTAFDQFGTSRLIGPGKTRVDFAATRTERYAAPAALPVVSSPARILEDLARRDFTINAMALRLTSSGFSRMLDPFGGLGDLKSRRIQILHPGSFRDDPTRVFRAARYAARLGFQCSGEILHAAREALKARIPRQLSRHRLAREFMKILSEKNPAASLGILKSWGYLDLIHPRLSQLGYTNLRGLAADVRLGVFALALGEDAEEFLASLPVERASAEAVSAAIKIAREKSSPRGALPDSSSKILKAVFPDKPRSSLLPLKVQGRDLEALGVKSGPRMGLLLKEAARLQWAGKIRSRAEALRWARSVINS